MSKHLTPRSVVHFICNWAAVIAIVLLVVLFSLFEPGFCTMGNLETIQRSISKNTVLAM